MAAIACVCMLIAPNCLHSVFLPALEGCNWREDSDAVMDCFLKHVSPYKTYYSKLVCGIGLKELHRCRREGREGGRRGREGGREGGRGRGKGGRDSWSLTGVRSDRRDSFASREIVPP